eukprot:m.75281 g.75281  ORF g.75281 m.75281 type:complete len:716 (+) comp8979_c0_seq2:81-2228(+)
MAGTGAHLSQLDPDAARMVQSMWQVPATAQFCSLFHKLFGDSQRREPFQLIDPEIEKLEESLAAPTIPEILIDLHIRLLRGYYDDKSIAPHNWVGFLRQFVDDAFPEHRNVLDSDDPLDDFRGYEPLTVPQRIKLLYHLCLARVAGVGDYVPPDMAFKGESRRAINELEPSTIRDPEEPLGYDSDGNAYWYFSGVRLYREVPPEEPASKAASKKKATATARKKGQNKRGRSGAKPKAGGSKNRGGAQAAAVVDVNVDNGDGSHPLNATPDDERWEVVCQTVPEWEELTAALKTKRNTPGWDLYKLLKDEFVPELREQWEREERRRQREARWAAVPRRVSSRQASLQAAQEERDRLEAIKEAKLMEEREARAKAAAERAEARKLREREERRMERERLRLEALQPIATARPRSKRRRVGTESPTPSSDAGPSVPDWRMKALTLHKTLLHLTSSIPFSEPVDEEDVPGYYDVITEPMDLRQILFKLQDNEYASVDEYESDIRLIFSNCISFFSPHDGEALLGRNLEQIFNVKFAEAFPPAAEAAGEAMDEQESVDIPLDDSRPCADDEARELSPPPATVNTMSVEAPSSGPPDTGHGGHNTALDLTSHPASGPVEVVPTIGSEEMLQSSSHVHPFNGSAHDHDAGANTSIGLSLTTSEPPLDPPTAHVMSSSGDHDVKQRSVSPGHRNGVWGASDASGLTKGVACSQPSPTVVQNGTV